MQFVALVVIVVYLAYVASAFAPVPAYTYPLVSLSLVNVAVFAAIAASLAASRLRRHWRVGAMIAGSTLVATETLIHLYVPGERGQLMALVLISMSWATFLPWGPVWQGALNLICLAAFAIREDYFAPGSAFGLGRWIDLGTALVFAQAVATFAGRYRKRISRQVVALADGEKRFRKIFELGLDAVAIASLPEIRLVDVNDEWLRAAGFEREEVLGRTIAELGILERPDALHKAVEELGAGGIVRNREARFWSKDRKLLYGLYSATLIELGGRECLLIVGRDITERKRAEEELREAQRRLTTVVTNAPIVLWALDRDGVVTFADGAALRAVGLKPGQIVGRNIFEARMFQSYPTARENARRALAGESFTSVVDVGGTLLESSYSAIRGADGSVTGAIGVATDVTERKRAEQRLRESENRFKEVFRYSAEPMTVSSVSDWLYTDVNEAMVEMTGYGREELIGKAPADLWFDQPGLEAATQRLLKDGIIRDVEAKLRTKSGALKTVLISATVAELNGQQLAIASGRDITELKRVQDEHALLASIVRSSDDAIYSLTLDGAVTSWNPAAEKLFGYSAAEIVGRDVKAHLWADVTPEARRLIAEIGAGKGIQQYETTRKRKDETIVEVSITLFSIHDAAGAVTGAGAIVRDITERKRAERALIEAHEAALEAARLKSAFLANMSHEIRSPLNIILGYNELVADRLAELGQEDQRPFIEAINSAGKRLQDTIHDILDLSKIEARAFEVKPVRLELGPIVERLVRDFGILAARKGLALRCKVEAPEAEVMFDEYCLTQALTNLLQNAIKFTQEGGITVALGRDPHGQLWLGVRDTGLGIDQAYLRRIFEPFSQEDSGYTRRFEGAGLGLALTRSYVELNGARLTVESKKGEGTLFTIHFTGDHEILADADIPPRASAASTSPAAATVARASEVGQPLLVVVEDDPDTLSYMRALLGRHYRILAASNGEEFRAQLAANNGRIEAILMDLSLGGAEDGLALTRYVRAEPHWKDLPIVAVTAHALTEDRAKALGAGCDAYLTKPIGRDALLKVLGELVQAWRKGAARPASGAPA